MIIYHFYFCYYNCAGCGATFTDITYGRIVSPGYPNRDYPNSFTCEYVINWATGKMLALRFDRQFEIEGMIKKLKVTHFCNSCFSVEM